MWLAMLMTMAIDRSTISTLALWDWVVIVVAPFKFKLFFPTKLLVFCKPFSETLEALVFIYWSAWARTNRSLVLNLYLITMGLYTIHATESHLMLTPLFNDDCPSNTGSE